MKISDMPKDELGRLLRKLRKDARVTEAEMAVAQDVTVKTIQNWERGHTKPRLGDVKIYENQCGRTIVDLREPPSSCVASLWDVRPIPSRRKFRRARRRPEITLIAQPSEPVSLFRNAA